MSRIPRVIQLKEYETTFLPRDKFTETQAKRLYQSFDTQVEIEAPSFKNDDQWGLKSRGWVGYIPLEEDVHLSLNPKVPVRNLFRMLEYAYRLNFRILEGLVDSDSMREFYERLAVILAKRISDRVRKGLFRAYEEKRQDLPYVRGRIDLRSHVMDPLRITIPCEYEEHTSDVEDNQILAWTLEVILKSGLCGEDSRRQVLRARRALLGFCSVQPISPVACANRIYSRLNADYEPMHALCRFFLEQSGPSRLPGDRRMLPVLINMNRLFELFVVEWLKQHMPVRYRVRDQERVTFEGTNIKAIKIDITIEDTETGRTCMVLDTKYKVSPSPAAQDLEQAVAYANAKYCRDAVLVYPIELDHPVNAPWGKHVHLRTLGFCLDGDLEKEGLRFLAELMQEGSA